MVVQQGAGLFDGGQSLHRSDILSDETHPTKESKSVVADPIAVSAMDMSAGTPRGVVRKPKPRTVAVHPPPVGAYSIAGGAFLNSCCLACKRISAQKRGRGWSAGRGCLSRPVQIRMSAGFLTKAATTSSRSVGLALLRMGGFIRR
jgi:hypothetical protein